MAEVFWIDVEGMSIDNSVSHKIKRLFNGSGAAEGIEEQMRVALKINTSEDGYEYGLRPVFIRSVSEEIQKVASKTALICDGLRLIDYHRKARGQAFKEVGRGKGYNDETLGGSFAINGGFSGDEANLYTIKAKGSMLGGVEVGTSICRTDALIVLSHVTLHPLFGMNGALFNGGFESLSAKERIRVLERLNPYIFNGEIPPKDQLDRFHMRALEGHLGVRESVSGRVFYMNFLWDVTPQPEYYPYSEAPFVQNIGFLASSDPVSLDAATYGLICEFSKEEDPIKCRTGIDFQRVLEEAANLELGTLDYNIKRSS
jgi:uncharacterized Fe-S center protein